MDSKNFAIGVLSTTAMILLVGLLIISTRPDPAYASGMTATSGNYSLTVGRISPAEEVLYVIDTSQEKLLTYSFDTGRRSIVPIQIIDLNQVRQETSTRTKGQQPTSPKGQRGTRPRRTRP